MITKIEWTNLKGTSRALDLKPLTVITGRNHAGKSAVLNALTLAGLGYLPALGKTNTATFRLASGKEMTVRASDGDAMNYVFRSWKVKGNGVTASTEGDSGPMGIPLAVIDPPTFIAANAKTRLSMLAGLAGGDELTTLADKCRDWAKRLGRPMSAIDDAIVTAQELRDLAAAKAKAAADTVKANTATLQTLAGDERLGVKVSDKERKAAREALEKAVADLTRAQNLAGELERAANAAADAQEELETLESGVAVDPEVIDRLKSSRAALSEMIVAVEGELKIHQGTIRLRREELAGLESTAAKTDIDTAAEMLTAAEESNATPESLAEFAEYVRRIEADIASNNRDLGRVNGQVAAASANIAGLESMECCPVCMAAEDGWKKKALTSYRIQRDEAEAEGLTLEASHRALAKQLADTKQKIAEFQAALANKAKIPALRAIVTAWTKIPRLKATIAELERQESDQRGVIDGMKAELAEADAELSKAVRVNQEGERFAALRRIIADRPTDEQVNKAIDAVAILEDVVDTARGTLEDVEARAQMAAQGQTVTAKIADCEAVIEAENTKKSEFETLKDEIAAGLDDAIAGAYAPILQRVKEFGDNVIARDITVNDDGEIGYKNGVGFVPFEAMSGTEQTVVIAAIQAALSTVNGSILMIDEISRLDATNKAQFAKNIAAAIDRGTLKQAVIIDHDGPAWADFYTIPIE